MVFFFKKKPITSHHLFSTIVIYCVNSTVNWIVGGFKKTILSNRAQLSMCFRTYSEIECIPLHSKVIN